MKHPIILLLQAAYTAQDAIERMQDPSSIQTANAALGAYAQALLEVAPAHQLTLTQIRDERERGVPTLSELHRDYLAAYISTYSRIHNAQPAAA